MAAHSILTFVCFIMVTIAVQAHMVILNNYLLSKNQMLHVLFNLKVSFRRY